MDINQDSVLTVSQSLYEAVIQANSLEDQSRFNLRDISSNLERMHNECGISDTMVCLLKLTYKSHLIYLFVCFVVVFM